MTTTAKLKPDGNYEIFQDGQRMATGTSSVLSQYGLSETNLTNEAITPSGQKVNPITGQIIGSDVLGNTPDFNPVSPTFSPPSDISGLQEIKMTSQEVKQTDLEKQMAELQLSLAGKPAFEAEKRTEFGVATAQQAYDDLNTQLRDLQRQQQLVPLTIQQQSEGRGRTEGGVEPLEIGKRRALAYDALTTSSLMDAAQGRLASAERKVIEAVNQKFAPQQAVLDALEYNLNLVKNSPQTTVQEMNRANQQEAIRKARQEVLDKAKEQAQNILNWANKASENMAKQGTLDPVMLNKIKNSKTESEAFALAAPFLAVKDKLTGQSDFEQAFLRDTGRLPTVAELQAYKVSQEKPTFQTFERMGADGVIHNIIMTLDPMTGKVISEVDLGAKENISGMSGNVKSDADSIMAGTANLQDLPTKDGYRAKVSQELTTRFETAKKTGDIYGTMKASAIYDKEPGDTFLQSMEKTISVLGQLETLQKNIEGVATGPIVGAFRAKNPWDTKAQTIKAQLNAIVPNLARGVYGEVGVLTDNDIKTYSKTIPNLSSTEDIRNAILYITVDMIQRNIENKIKNQAAGQRDMSGYAEIYKMTQETADGILDFIPRAKKTGEEINPEEADTGTVIEFGGFKYRKVGDNQYEEI